MTKPLKMNLQLFAEKPLKNKKMWQIKQSAETDAIDMYIYGDVEGDYFDWWEWEMVESETSANHFREELNKYPNIRQINLYVNSYGGSVYEAMSIRNQLKRHPAHKTGYVDGFACSAASFILTACDEVLMYSNTMQMIHDMWNVSVGNARDHRKMADDLDTIMAGNRQAYLEKSNGKITEEKLIELLEAETWLTAQQCVEYGLADKIIGKEADLTAAKQMLQKVNKTLEQQLSYNKALLAQVRELKQGFKPKTEPKEPIIEPVIDQKQTKEPEQKENKVLNLIAALYR